MTTKEYIDFMDKHDFQKRKDECDRILRKYPDRIPVIAEVAKGCNLPPLDKNKFLVPSGLTVGQFQYVIRQRLELEPEKAIFLFIGEDCRTLASSGGLLSTLYRENKNIDGFLYVKIQSESTFG